MGAIVERENVTSSIRDRISGLVVLDGDIQVFASEILIVIESSFAYVFPSFQEACKSRACQSSYVMEFIPVL